MIEVIDRGVGMSPAFIETELFKPFTTTKKTGFGIGMYQCRDWIEHWQGKLEVKSEPGRGTTIRMLLPLAAKACSGNSDAGTTEDITPAKEHAA